MQKVIKVIAVVMAVLIAGGVTSCSKNGASSNVDKALAEQFKDYKVQKSPETKKVYNFDAFEVRIGDWWSSTDGTRGEPAKSPMQELTKNFNEFIMQTYNCTIDQYGLGGWDTHPETVAKLCTTGTDENYVLIVDMRSLGSGIKTNLFYDLSKLKDIDWNAKKWDKATRDLTTKGSSFYAMRPIPAEPRDGIFFNKRLLSEANINPESIYDMQKDGTWTWQTFEDMLKAVTRDTDNDGIIDVWGQASNMPNFCYSAVISNGGAFIKKDANGNFANGFGDEKTIEAMTWTQNMVKNYTKPQPDGANWDWFYPAFMNGETCFIVDQEYNVDRFAEMNDDWGFVCFPYGPSGDKIYQNISNDFVYVIPAVYGEERIQKIAKVFDLWTDEIPGLPEDSWKDDYYVRFRDTRAVDETLQFMRDRGTTNMLNIISGINQGGNYIWNVYPGYITPQEGYEQTKNEFDALIADMN